MTFHCTLMMAKHLCDNNNIFKQVLANCRHFTGDANYRPSGGWGWGAGRDSTTARPPCQNRGPPNWRVALWHWTCFMVGGVEERCVLPMLRFSLPNKGTATNFRAARGPRRTEESGGIPSNQLRQVMFQAEKTSPTK